MNNRLLRFGIILAAAAVIVGGILLILHKPKPAPAPHKERPKAVRPGAVARKGAIAIVIDDIGYTSANFGLYEQIKEPVTLSILPNLAYSAQASELLHGRFQVILHLPMEPKATAGSEKDTILVTMDEAAIRGIIDADLANLKYAKGVSNHQGSKATEDPVTMGRVFGELKKRKLFFLDSFVTPGSVCVPVAKTAGIRWARRDVFLDNQLNPEYIRKQLVLLGQKAISKGSAIGVCHDRTITLEVLRDELPRMAKEGFTFVFISDLLN
jgi:uncharacterized protein